MCDDNCLQWKSSQICSHVVAVSEKLGELSSFLKWFISTKQQPNVAMHGLPAGSGRKGNVPKRKRSKTASACDVYVVRPAISTPASSGEQRSSTPVHDASVCDSSH